MSGGGGGGGGISCSGMYLMVCDTAPVHTHVALIHSHSTPGTLGAVCLYLQWLCHGLDR